VKKIERAIPHGLIYLIADNLKIHDSALVREWLEGHPRIEHAFIPKGAAWLNLISALYQVGEVSLPVAFELVKKSEWIFNDKRKKWQRKSPQTKNEMYRRMLSACQNNRLKFRYVLSDVWYSASENMSYIKEELQKEFIMPLKSNRKVALSLEDKKQGAYERVGSLELEPNTVMKVYLEQVGFALLLCKRVFKNEDGSEGVLYLVGSDLTLD
jgi:tRNA(Glu) U13 pseudouridine synthase TruD